MCIVAENAEDLRACSQLGLGGRALYSGLMDHPLIDLISQKIAKAEADGEFDNLPGAGKPLPKVDDPENAVFDRIIKESGGVPEFVSLSRELTALRDELRDTDDRTKRADILKHMSMIEAKIEIARKQGR